MDDLPLSAALAASKCQPREPVVTMTLQLHADEPDASMNAGCRDSIDSQQRGRQKDMTCAAGFEERLYS